MKALALISGGLDSILAARLVKEQGIETIPLYFKIPFCNNQKTVSPGQGVLDKISDILGEGLRRIDISSEFIGILERPNHGFGANMNPCIDCKILMLSRARELMPGLGASFIVTGEVLGQRPMSQHREALGIIEKRSGLQGLLLRPLSARLLEETVPEKEGWVDRKKLLNLAGRARRPQMELANIFKINEYPNPAGGCLLTDPHFSRRLKDLMRHGELNLNNIGLLKVGRHFRIGEKTKLVVGRNQEENEQLSELAAEGDYLFNPPPEIAGPTCIGRGFFDQALIELACGIILRYCDTEKSLKSRLSYRLLEGGEESQIEVAPLAEDSLNALRI